MHSHGIRFAIGVLLLSFGSLTAAEPTTTGPAESPADLPEALRYNYPPVPPAQWDEYVREVKSEGWFEAAQALREEAIAPQIERWSKDWGKPLDAKFAPFLELAGMNRNAGQLRLENLVVAPSAPQRGPIPPGGPSPAGSDSSLKAWVFRPRGGNQLFLVPASEVQALMFPVLLAVGTTHPLNETLPTFESDNESLWTVARRILDQTGIQYDFAFNRASSEVLLSLRLTNRTRFQCLKTAVEAANFELATHGFGTPASVRDPSASFHDVRRAYQEKKNVAPAAAEDPVRILEQRLQDAIKSVQEGRDITIGLRPRFPSTDVKVNVDESGRRR